MRKNILVIADSPLVLSMLTDMLEDLGYGVRAVGSGYEGCREV